MFGIYAVDLSAGLSEEVYNCYLQCLSEERRKKVQAFLRRQDSVRALIAQLLLRLTIIELLEIPPAELEFSFNKYGKPSLVQPGNFHFNLSHSGDWVALVTDTAPVGVDVEQVKEIDMDIAKRFFSPREYTDLLALPAEQRSAYFFDLWTLKESYIKAVGMGLSLPLDSFSMIREKDSFRILTAREGTWFFRQYLISPGYKFAVCRTLNSFLPAIDCQSLPQLYQKFQSLQGWF